MSLSSQHIFRPLLCTEKSEIIEYSTIHSIVFCEDSSNLDTNYDRNRLRHEIMPKIAKINPEYTHTLSEL
jgi:tRNA(Ile)-lysidine synthase